VRDGELDLSFTHEDLIRYHGAHSPGGVAHAFKVLERALPLLSPGEPPQRREIVIRTAFGGPGARDGFEMVTRAVTGGRYTVDAALARPELGAGRRFVFVLSYRGTDVTLAVRPGIVTDEFVALAGREERSAGDEARLETLKREMADRVMGLDAAEVFTVT
jgi:hypothetical protein